MQRFETLFAALQERNEKALVTFVTAGDPFPDATAEVILSLADAGSDIIEIGVPFSDPLADGPTIQASSFRALQAGMTPPKVLEIVRQVRTKNQTTPLVLMGAWNTALQYGPEKFANDAKDAGVDGTIMTDLTPEEAGEWKRLSDEVGLATIFLLAPTSTLSRISLVGRMASGFLYYVSRTGVTGARTDVPDDLPAMVSSIKSRTEIPVCVGFGVSKPEHVRAICQHADGAVVGSSLVDFLHKERENPQLLSLTRDYVASLKTATRPS